VQLALSRLIARPPTAMAELKQPEFQFALLRSAIRLTSALLSASQKFSFSCGVSELVSV